MVKHIKIDFSGKKVLITGATRGIGQRIADDMESCGANLVLTGTDAKRIKTLNEEATQKGLKRRYDAVDFTDRAALEEWIQQLCFHETIDVCINNAGINRINSISEVKNDDWDAIAKVNLEAPLIITRQVSKQMKERRYGRIVNIASIFGVLSRAQRSLYSISKFGLRGLTVASALDLAPFNVLVNAVSPGFVLTDLTTSILSDKEIKQLASQVPLGRFATPDEISKTVLFLASDLNTYMTGQNVVVDGGFISV